MDKCKINLIQSYETEVDSNSELEQIVSAKSFKEKLTSEMDLYKLLTTSLRTVYTTNMKNTNSKNTNKY